ncbi:MAG: UvrD-helicase domain-containing protein, partial [Gammaproteobacteria bacterium]|nr:UvrD-helicase domain-containing protein [Gammaproteobacteria bacterium]
MTRPAFLDARGSLELGLSGINLIEASAGTGKTYTIANLYLRHILEGRKPAEILVVSFTNAATDELHQRIHARLYQAWEVLKSGQAPQDEFLTRLLSQQLA